MIIKYECNKCRETFRRFEPWGSEDPQYCKCGGHFDCVENPTDKKQVSTIREYFKNSSMSNIKTGAAVQSYLKTYGGNLFTTTKGMYLTERGTDPEFETEDRLIMKDAVRVGSPMFVDKLIIYKKYIINVEIYNKPEVEK
jgi:hypothetical protein